MRHPPRGFTLLELMIVIAIIAIIAGIAIPNLIAARSSANETAAIATLRNLSGAQAQFQQRAKVDQDAAGPDGVGEYGFFPELSGGVAGRMAVPLVPPAFSSAFQAVGPNGEVTRSGYVFLVYLPDAAGAGVDWAAAATVDPDYSEAAWCAYAWPINHGQTGTRTFFVNQAGDILSIDAGPGVYDGPITGGDFPAADAAYRVANDMTSEVDVGGPGQCGVAGAAWVQVQ